MQPIPSSRKRTLSRDESPIPQKTARLSQDKRIRVLEKSIACFSRSLAMPLHNGSHFYARFNSKSGELLELLTLQDLVEQHLVIHFSHVHRDDRLCHFDIYNPEYKFVTFHIEVSGEDRKYPLCQRCVDHPCFMITKKARLNVEAFTLVLNQVLCLDHVKNFAGQPTIEGEPLKLAHLISRDSIDLLKKRQKKSFSTYHSLGYHPLDLLVKRAKESISQESRSSDSEPAEFSFTIEVLRSSD